MGICLSLLAVMSLKYLSNQTKSPATSASKEANNEQQRPLHVNVIPSQEKI